MAKKGDKSKFISKDLDELINESQFLTKLPKVNAKAQKRQKVDEMEDDDEIPIPKLIAEFQNAKKKKTCNAEDGKGVGQKLLEVLEKQLDGRKESDDYLLHGIVELLTQMEADYNVLIDNKQKLEHMVANFLKCVQQSTTAAKRNLKVLEEFLATFKKQCEELDNEQRAGTNKLAHDLEADVNQLQQKLVAETKRKQLEHLRQSIYHAIQNDL